MAKREPGKNKGRGAGRKARVDFRRNRQVRPRPGAPPAHRVEQADDDSLALAGWETVAAKGELSRKRTVVERPDDETTVEGIVVAVRGLVADVETLGGERFACTVRRVLRTMRIRERHPVTVGDRVRFRPVPVKGDAPPEGTIESVLPRRTELCRATEKRVHLIAANVDQVVIVASVDWPPLKPSLIDRYLVSASAGQLTAIVCVNKIDLGRTPFVDDVLARYARLGYTTIASSSVSGEGIDQLRDVLAGRSSVIAGQSGVGKSSLLNAIQPGLRLRTGDVIADLRKGRHTTTTAQLLRLDAGGYVVDTPGIRAFELAMVPPGDLEAHFVEIAERVAGCHFADCTHIHEDDCAVQAAVEQGEIHPERYESYVRLFKERCGLVPMEDYEPDVRR